MSIPARFELTTVKANLAPIGFTVEAYMMNANWRKTRSATNHTLVAWFTYHISG